ncbi:glycosyltransferase [Acetobacter tropicalis]|uniref:Glycosyl transferase n=1 Tax=Acetobacter tropicalis NBRC 101654 TaxID=749388 RepID=F7VAR3_9PROT|nr:MULTISPECIES: glycosyltransferase family 2 protein [Acetobacter]MCG4253427.1 glycosyltransferase family 2 protein [Acetobacter senegalensis]GAA07458.1 glycosyl transferase [Acetobacter tropicalis NBRC 101654]
MLITDTDAQIHQPTAFQPLSSSYLQRSRIVAIPACNEAEHIVPCLMALARQEDFLPHKVIVWVNNTQDDTRQQIHALQDALPFAVESVSVSYSPDQAHAGRARHDAMAHAAQHAPPDALLFTTDADGEVAPDWMKRTLEAFIRYNVAAVFGRALLLPSEFQKIPLHLHQDDEKEQAYAALLEHIKALLVPTPYDPWPRHSERSGASIAVTREAWQQVGGIPPEPLSEDRAFYTALRQAALPVRHAPDVKVYVSARLVGRARGGMADTIARRIMQQDDYLDDALEPVSICMLRTRRPLKENKKYLDIKNILSNFTNKPVRVKRADLHLHLRRAQRVIDFLLHKQAYSFFTVPHTAGDPAGRSRPAQYGRSPNDIDDKPE